MLCVFRPPSADAATEPFKLQSIILKALGRFGMNNHKQKTVWS